MVRWDMGRMVNPQVNAADAQRKQALQQVSGAMAQTGAPIMGSLDAPGTTPQMVQNYNAQFGVRTPMAPGGMTATQPGFGSGIAMPGASPSSQAIAGFANLPSMGSQNAPGTTQGMVDAYNNQFLQPQIQGGQQPGGGVVGANETAFGGGPAISRPMGPANGMYGGTPSAINPYAGGTGNVAYSPEALAAGMNYGDIWSNPQFANSVLRGGANFGPG